MDINAIAIRKVLFPLLRVAKGNHTLEYIRNFKKTQYLSEAEILNLQKEKLK